MTTNAFCDLARDCFQYLESDYGFREHQLDAELYTNPFLVCLTDDVVWFLVEGGKFGFNADLSVYRHDPNRVARWPSSNINIELLLATRRGDGEDYLHSEIARGEVPLEEKMSYLSKGLLLYGSDLISGNLSEIAPQVYLVEHYNGEDKLNDPAGIKNPKGRRMIGIFSCFNTADAAIRKLSNEIGFKHSKEKFVISCYRIDQTWWNAGFKKDK